MSLRLLNSVCKVLTDKYPNTAVRISEVSQQIERPCFFVTLTTSSQSIKNYCVYQNDLNFQIIYFGVRNETGQVIAESLYQIQEELIAIFLLRLSVPVIPLEGSTEKPRYAKVESFSSDIRLDEGAVYAKLVLNFTDDVPHNEAYDLIETVEMDTQVSTK